MIKKTFEQRKIEKLYSESKKISERVSCSITSTFSKFTFPYKSSEEEITFCTVFRTRKFVTRRVDIQSIY